MSKFDKILCGVLLFVVVGVSMHVLFEMLLGLAISLSGRDELGILTLYATPLPKGWDISVLQFPRNIAFAGFASSKVFGTVVIVSALSRFGRAYFMALVFVLVAFASMLSVASQPGERLPDYVWFWTLLLVFSLLAAWVGAWVGEKLRLLRQGRFRLEA
jgi:hypothetical protein